MNRVYSLDVARLVFAFLVVTIHIPPIGFGVISPFAYLGVPFFYVLTGFFIYSNQEQMLGIRLGKSLKNYARMWVTYFLILTCGTLLLKWVFNNNMEFTAKQLIDLFWTYGNCSYVELVTIDGQGYGTSALWFLYGGILSLGILFVLRRHLFKHWFALLVAAVWVAYALFNVEQQTVYVPRTIGASLPYIYAGVVLPRFITNRHYTIKWLLKFSALAIGLLYVEYLLLRPNLNISH